MYMKNQENINEMMRAILIDWLVEVHMKFKLYPNTLYLCVNIVDRYCSMVEVQRPKLQLVGVAALLLACKYEEIYPPEVRDCVYITDRAYTRQELLDMEQNIVEKLDFKLTVPTGHPFLVRYLLVVQASELAKAAANYYMERTLQEYEFLQYRPSLVAAAAVCLALNNPQIRSKDNAEGPKPGIPDVLLQYTGYSKDAIFEVAERIVENIGVEPVSASQRPLVSVKKKFAHRNFFSVSNQIIDPEIDDLLGKFSASSPALLLP
jgi:cyclin B